MTGMASRISSTSRRTLSTVTVHTAIICPPIIYGSGRGTGNTKSAKAYWLAAAVLKRRNGLLIGEGKKIWHQVHIQT
ncbi:hypothetical protein N7491_006341 [Penicillium cf. griseofulvum]|nr:hypothetical protein N7491_006341 [Penicillium cf. griseofulvum]